jgi:hypothetical protein
MEVGQGQIGAVAPKGKKNCRKLFCTSSSFQHFNCAYLLFAHVNVCIALDQMSMGGFITEHYGYCSVLCLLITYAMGSVNNTVTQSFTALYSLAGDDPK